MSRLLHYAARLIAELDPPPEPSPSIPLSRAALCENCATVVVAAARCSVCESLSIVPLQGITDPLTKWAVLGQMAADPRLRMRVVKGDAQ